MGKGRIGQISLWSAATAVGASLTSDAIKIDAIVGEAIGLLVTIAVGATVDLDATLTVCDTADGTYRTPVDTGGNSLGNIAIGVIAAASTYWIQFPPVLAPFMKITLADGGTDDGNSTVVGKLILQADN